MKKNIIFTLISLAAMLASTVCMADEIPAAAKPANEEGFVSAQPVDAEPAAASPAEARPATPKPTGLMPVESNSAADKPAAQAMPAAPASAMQEAPDTASQPEATHMHNPARDKQTDYRYCLDLKTDAEIAACRYKK
jgi:hypothetical protein